MELLFLAILIALMAGALASGFPVAFALPGSAIISIALAAACGWLFTGNPDAFFAQGGPLNWLNAGVTNFRGIYWEVERDTLIAIPLFVFMGIMLQRSKIAEDLLVSMAQLFGPVRGGLGISVVVVGALLAATTGIVGATVVAMGLISLPAMLRNNYSHSLATGTIAASGTLGQIIPPSIVLIILADQLSSAVDQADASRRALYKDSTGDLLMPSEYGVTSTSAGDMFMGALIPGLVLVGFYIVYILLWAFLRPRAAPAVPYDGSYDREFAARVLLSLIPPLALIIIVLGSIITGIATVNQAGAIGAAGAMIMAGYRLPASDRRRYGPAVLGLVSVAVIILATTQHPINIRTLTTQTDMIVFLVTTLAVIGLTASLIWSGIRIHRIDDTMNGVMMETAKTSALVFIILLGAAMLTAAFRAFGGEELVREFLTGLPGGFWTQFIIVMAVIFILGFFLDFIEIAVVVVPIVAPILLMDPSANITAVWLGVMIGLNIQTSFLTPPFGFALFYLRGVAPAVVRTISMYKGVVPFISLQLLALVVVGYTPALVNYLPFRLSLTGETAPPPKNPKLQACIEDYLHSHFEENEGDIARRIADARSWDLSMLPTKLRNDLTRSLDNAEKAFPALQAAFAASEAIDTAAETYKPLHIEVRRVQAEIRGHEEEIKELQTQIRRLLDGETERSEALTRRLSESEAELAQLKTEIPAEWADARKAFTKLLSEDKKARLAYRRTVDTAYEPLMEIRAMIDGADGLAAVSEEMKAISSTLESGDPKALSDRIQQVEGLLGDVAGSYPIRQSLSKVRRALDASTPKLDDARAEFDKAQAAYDEEATWRKAAQASLQAKLAEWDDAIKNSIGLRLQTRLPREIALDVAACQSHHKDISLFF